METLDQQLPSYLSEGQSINDEVAVSTYLQYLTQQDIQVDSIVVERTNEGVIVHTCIGNNTRRALSGINWYSPTKYPRDYSDYPSRWHRFIFPNSTQEARAQLLAKALSVPLVIEEHPEGLFTTTLLRKRAGEQIDLIEIPSLHYLVITEEV